MSDLPHPLALDLAATLHARPKVARVLLIGIGSGRNVPPLLEAGLHVDAVEADVERARGAALRFALESRVRVARARYAGPLPVASGCDGALSTHALLHGTPHDVAAAALATANRLRPGAPFFTTLGSVDDPRFNRGTRIDDSTFAADEGPESGVPHAYFTRGEVARVLACFLVESIESTDAESLVGSWAAHADGEPIVHWFVKARRL